MVILGLNAFHGDASACLAVDGVLVAAAEEERFRRIKHWAGFPMESIRYCLSAAGLQLADVEHLAINSNPRAQLLRKLAYTLAKRPQLKQILGRVANIRRRLDLTGELAAVNPNSRFAGTVHRVEHHYAHLASAYFVSPFERSVAVSVDGFGDFASTAWGVGEHAHLRLDGRVFFPHSLGLFYQALTQYLGFPHYGDEYKVMGLAPYGEPSFLQKMRQIVQLRRDGTFRLNLDYFRHAREKIVFSWEGGAPEFGTLYTPALVQLLGAARGKDEPLLQRHRDLARSVQAMYEEAFFHLLNHLHERYRQDAVVVAGGCGMNSVANGKITLKTPFAKVYVQAAAGDAGGAIGAAYAIQHRLGTSRRFVMNHASWGPEYSNRQIETALAARSEDLAIKRCLAELVADEAELCRRTAEAIAQGRVIGWFQGRMEWGPRALGNRSIVCDPRRADMKDILNHKIKRRESFRPFAPSILREAVPQWFELDGDVPFMMQVFQIRAERRAAIPAVTHVDGSGRLQTVERSSNPRYYRLIQAFEGLTGVPMVLNTSFNENEPVVCQPQEALDCFLRTDMDLLVLQDYIIERRTA
jgi:carbamoyltransferase